MAAYEGRGLKEAARHTCVCVCVCVCVHMCPWVKAEHLAWLVLGSSCLQPFLG